MKVLITGSTGMIGSLVLRQCIEHPDVTEIISLCRRPSKNVHSKVSEVIVSDFLALDEDAMYFRNIHAVYYCLGVYTGAVDKDKFVQITVDYPETLARVVSQKSPGARFCLLSGAGADRTEKSKMAFAKAKGTIENRLSQVFPGTFHTFRPGYIYPVVARQEPGTGYRILRWLYPIIRLFGDNSSIRSTDLASAIFTAGLFGNPSEVLENRDIVKLANASPR